MTKRVFLCTVYNSSIILANSLRFEGYNHRFCSGAKLQWHKYLWGDTKFCPTKLLKSSLKDFMMGYSHYSISLETLLMIVNITLK